MPLQIQVPMEKIEAFCRKWKMQHMWLFGSAMRDDFGPEARWSLLDLVGAEQELSEIMDRPVDLVERQCVEQSHNWIRRRHILESARMVYVAR